MTTNPIFLHALTISVIRYAKQHGLTDREIHKSLNMDLTQLDLSKLFLTTDQLLCLIQSVSQKNNIIFTGFHTAKYMKISDFGIAGYVLMNCRNMKQVLEKYETYHQLMGNVTRLAVNIEDDRVKYCWRPVKDLPLEIERIVMEYLVASIITHSYELTGKKLQIQEVEFSWPAPDDLSEYTQLLGSRLSFDKPQTALYFDKSYLKLPVKTSNSELLSVFESHAQERYRKLTGNSSLSEKVTGLLIDRITCLPKMESLAEELGMSPRNFQMVLKDEGTSYLKLRDKIRFEYAKRALETDSCTAAEISVRLGFSEPSAFFRTFKRWSGKTPGRYRKEERS